jgi:hypothetical protein
MNKILKHDSCRLTLLIMTLFWYSPSFADSEISIKTAGADLANFPNSANTLPQGRAYVEVSAVNFNGKSDYSPQQYSAGYLLRYGLLDDLELRLMSSGFTIVNDEDKTSGMSPQTFDFKWHVFDGNETANLPAVGVEFSVQTDWAKSAFRNGINPALSLNFDQTLPFDIELEYNVGFVSQHLESGDAQYQLALSWALQHDVYEDVAVFVNGYTNTAAGLTTSAIGGGAQWIPIERLALFANVSAGLTVSTPSIFSLVGFAVAF